MTLPTYSTPFTDDASTVTADFLNGYVRTQIPKALDGVGGSNGTVSTPSTAILLGGAGLEMRGPFVLGTGSSGTVQSGITWALASGSTFTNAATQTRTGPEVLSGVGATTAWRTVDGADADGTYDVTYDEIRVPEVLSALRLYTLRHSTSPVPPVGARIRFSRNGPSMAESVRIRREDTTLLATLPASGFSSVVVCYMTAPTDATARWRVVDAGGNTQVAAVL